MQTVVCANSWDLLLVPGAEISQSCALGQWWARDDRRRPKGGAHAHVGSKAPGCKQAFCAWPLTLQGPWQCREEGVPSRAATGAAQEQSMSYSHSEVMFNLLGLPLYGFKAGSSKAL